MNKEEIIQIGRQVLEIEAGAVHNLAENLDENFAHAVEILSNSRSRVIVSGIGKSGLISRKIAATLASCGTPALFIHPVEAGHGDLGMIVEKDIMIIISYSGDTREVLDLLEFVKRRGIKLISITGNRESKLAMYSDIVLEARVEQEAEPSGFIPTASSTAALAIGDALAVAVMKQKGFNESDFAFFHPKGQAGKKLVRIRTIMHKGQEVPRVRKDASMQQAVIEMTGKKMGMTCIVDAEDHLIGIITDGDLRRMLEKYGDRLLEKTAQECMTVDPVTINQEDLAAGALKIMEDNKITSLIVKSEEGKIQGIVHLHDLWRMEMF